MILIKKKKKNWKLDDANAKLKTGKNNVSQTVDNE